jgi:hypothetical protein
MPDKVTRDEAFAEWWSSREGGIFFDQINKFAARAAFHAATERAAGIVHDWPREFPSVEHTMLTCITDRIRGGTP